MQQLHRTVGAKIDLKWWKHNCGPNLGLQKPVILIFRHLYNLILIQNIQYVIRYCNTYQLKNTHMIFACV